jgi:thiol-disulfide isomerase/thioredoxin
MTLFTASQGIKKHLVPCNNKKTTQVNVLPVSLFSHVPPPSLEPDKEQVYFSHDACSLLANDKTISKKREAPIKVYIFTANWCLPCPKYIDEIVLPVLSQYKHLFLPIIVQVPSLAFQSAQFESSLIKDYQVKHVPTLVFTNGPSGFEIASTRMIGVLPRDQFCQRLSSFVQK